ncbi:MAG: DUF4410 domain-containing protein [Deltaproteobacteria bacterium]|nr:DUF4410 domain-containing protein [Deltaproteobacteria bacterium]
MSTKRRFAVSVLILMLFGCASSSIYMREPVSVKLSNYKTLLVDVSSNNKRYFSDAKNQLENLLISELRKKNLFKKVMLKTSSEGESADLHLSITILDLFKITRSDRMVWGYFVGGCFGGPGNAKIRVDVKLIDPETTKLIGECEVVGRSSHHSTFAGTTEQAIKLAVDKIVEYVHNNIETQTIS